MRRVSFNGLWAVSHRFVAPPVVGGNKPPHLHRAFSIAGMFYARRFVRVPGGGEVPGEPGGEMSHYIPQWRRRRR